MRHVAIKFVPKLNEMDLERFMKAPFITANYDTDRLIGKCLAVDGNAIKIEFRDSLDADFVFDNIDEFTFCPAWYEKDGQKILVEISAIPNQLVRKELYEKETNSSSDTR